MNEIRTGRSLARPRKIERSEHVARTYAMLRRGLPCEFGTNGIGQHPGCLGEELHHLIGGARREDADWNMVWICAWHHRSPVYGFHGSKPAWSHERAFRMKLEQGYRLPREAYAYLPGGIDSGPAEHPDQEFNREVTRSRAEDAREV